MLKDSNTRKTFMEAMIRLARETEKNSKEGKPLPKFKVSDEVQLKYNVKTETSKGYWSLLSLRDDIKSQDHWNPKLSEVGALVEMFEEFELLISIDNFVTVFKF